MPTVAVLKQKIPLENVPYGDRRRTKSDPNIRGVRMVSTWSRACAEHWSAEYGFDVRPGPVEDDEVEP